MSRRKIAAFVLAAAVIASLGGWVAGRQISSPAEVAARTAAPNASPILVAAEERVLTSDVVTRGTGRFGSPQLLTTARSALKPDAGVVSSAPAAGAELAEGAVVLNLSGRPVFLLQGDRLGARDLGPGLEGEDVRQLEEGLSRLGMDPGPADGVYDGATEAAVTRWYEAAGFAPFLATEEQLASIRARESDLAKARFELHGADDAVAAAEADLVARQADYAAAVAAQKQRPAVIAAAQGSADAANLAAAADVAAKQAALDELRSSPGATPAEIAAAEAELANAQANATSTRNDGDKLVAEAIASGTGSNDVTVASAALRAAQRTLANARAAMNDQGRFVDFAAQEAQLEQRRAGVQVPADEVIFVRSTPVRVSELLVAPGEQVSGPVMKVTDSVVAVDGSLPLDSAALVEPGMAVQIDEPDLGIEAKGVVAQVADTPGTNGVDGFHVYFAISVEGSPPKLAGASVRLTVPVKSTGGKVLVVPTSALSLATDGSSRIERRDNGKTTFVTVKPGLSADGFVEVNADGGTLRAGDMVVIGIDQRNAAGSRG